MIREITRHKVNACNESLTIKVIDAPGSGGASHRYEVGGYNADANPSIKPGEGIALGTLLLFQNGPIKEAGVNGITQEVLLAVVADRLESFQAGPYACEDNAQALTHVLAAMHVLQNRTKARVERGVEGTHTV